MVQVEKTFDQRLMERVALGSFGQAAMKAMPQKRAENVGAGNWRFIGSVGFNGEKNLGEMGPIKNYYIEYEKLRARSWQLYLESDLAQTVLNKYNTWMIGKGLKLQAEPEVNILKQEGITLNREEFSKVAESRFGVYAGARMSDHSGMKSLNLLAKEAFKNAKVGGDLLVILRYVNNTVTIQLVDGAHVVSPIYGSESYPAYVKSPNGNIIINGIELSDTGEHVAYWVRKPGLNVYATERIAAKDENGIIRAYMVYGSYFRLDNHRGLPLLAVLFETAKKLERYKEATVGSAEERQKISLFFEHELNAIGENPMVNNLVKAWEVNRTVNNEIPYDDYGNELADRVAVTTNKQVFNLPPGATMKALNSKNELYFGEFYLMNIMLFSSAAQIPFEVAMSKYDSNFSASRAAIKDWEHVLNVGRDDFSFQFYQPIYHFFLAVNILQGKISAPGYLKAVMNNDQMVIEAYRKSRFTGASVPHIDPLKEVRAEREKLGPAGAHLPLTDHEQSVESLNGGDSNAVMEQFATELEKANALGIKLPEATSVSTSENA